MFRNKRKSTSIPTNVRQWQHYLRTNEDRVITPVFWEGYSFLSKGLSVCVDGGRDSNRRGYYSKIKPCIMSSPFFVLSHLVLPVPHCKNGITKWCYTEFIARWFGITKKEKKVYHLRSETPKGRNRDMDCRHRTLDQGDGREMTIAVERFRGESSTTGRVVWHEFLESPEE